MRAASQVRVDMAFSAVKRQQESAANVDSQDEAARGGRAAGSSVVMRPRMKSRRFDSETAGVFGAQTSAPNSEKPREIKNVN
jgi:hypothetical protein